MSPPEKLLGIPDIARERGVQRQTVWTSFKLGRLPPPDATNGQGRPLWKLSTLEKVGALRPKT